MNMTVTVNFGTYNVVENRSNNGVSLYKGERKVCDISNVHWWDKDNIERLMYSNKERILQADQDPKDKAIQDLQKKVSELEYTNKQVEITSNNVLEFLSKANEVLKDNISDAKIRGFVCSRLSQVTNKLKEQYA